MDVNLKLNSDVVIMDFGPVLKTLMEPKTIVEQPVLKEITTRLEDVILNSDSLVSLSNASYFIIIKTYITNGGTQTVINNLRLLL